MNEYQHQCEDPLNSQADPYSSVSSTALCSTEDFPSFLFQLPSSPVRFHEFGSQQNYLSIPVSFSSPSTSMNHLNPLNTPFYEKSTEIRENKFLNKFLNSPVRTRFSSISSDSTDSDLQTLEREMLNSVLSVAQENQSSQGFLSSREESEFRYSSIQKKKQTVQQFETENTREIAPSGSSFQEHQNQNPNPSDFPNNKNNSVSMENSCFPLVLPAANSVDERDTREAVRVGNNENNSSGNTKRVKRKRYKFIIPATFRPIAPRTANLVSEQKTEKSVSSDSNPRPFRKRAKRSRTAKAKRTLSKKSQKREKCPSARKHSAHSRKLKNSEVDSRINSSKKLKIQKNILPKPAAKSEGKFFYYNVKLGILQEIEVPSGFSSSSELLNQNSGSPGRSAPLLNPRHSMKMRKYRSKWPPCGTLTAPSIGNNYTRSTERPEGPSTNSNWPSTTSEGREVAYQSQSQLELRKWFSSKLTQNSVEIINENSKDLKFPQETYQLFLTTENDLHQIDNKTRVLKSSSCIGFNSSAFREKSVASDTFSEF